MDSACEPAPSYCKTSAGLERQPGSTRVSCPPSSVLQLDDTATSAECWWLPETISAPGVTDWSARRADLMKRHECRESVDGR
jgi:hypothetical protein